MVVAVAAALSLVAELTAPVVLPGSAAAVTSGVSLLPAAGQFVPLPGTAVLDSRYGVGLANPDLAPGSTLTFSVRSVGGSATGVPVDASAVVLEFNTQGNFAGVLSGGPQAGATDTSLTFPADVMRNGFDIATMAGDGTIAVAITGFSPIPSGATLSKLVVRLHGYYTGASTSSAGSTYVGYDPTLLASTNNSPSGFTLNGAGTSGPLTVGSNAYTVKVTGNAGVPADGSATAVAVQVIVQDPTCSGGFSLVPAGSGRIDYDGAFTAGGNGEDFDLVALPPSGQLSLQLLGCTGTATVIIRVRGYYSAPTVSTPGASFTPAKRKVFDTTAGTGTAACPTTADSPKLAAHSGCTVQVLGLGGFPADGVSGIAAQVVAVNPGHDGWLGLYSDDTVAHTATLWYSPDGRTSNFEVAAYTDVNPDGTVYLWNGGDYPVDVVVRAHGYYRAPTVPAAPSAVAVTAAGAGSASFSWTHTANDGGAAVTGYVIEADSDDGLDSVHTSTGPSATSANLGGLTSGEVYVFSVHAVNDVGSSEFSYPVDYKPGGDLYPPNTSSPSPAPTQTTSPPRSGPATLTGRILTPDGQPAAGYTVTISAAMDLDLPVTLGTTTTDATGTFSYTAPLTSALPDQVRQAVDTNNGVLNVVADAMGHLDGTSYTTAAAFGAPLGVGTTDGTLTVQAVEARSELATEPRQATLMISNETSTAPTSTDGGMATHFTSGSTAEDDAAAEDASTGWQSSTSLSSGGYSPMTIDGSDYTYRAQSPGPALSPSGQCYQGVDYRWTNGRSTTAYSLVGEAHAYYDATAGFSYTRTADSRISVGISYNSGQNWTISGTTEVSNSVSAINTGFSGWGPYWARKWREPFLYRAADKQWRCAEGGSWHYWYTHVYSAAYHIPPGQPAGKYGEWVKYDDGPRAYGWASAAQRTRVLRNEDFALARGRTRTYSFAASAFGFGPSISSAYSGTRTQSLHAGIGKNEHDVFTANPDTDINRCHVFYSF